MSHQTNKMRASITSYGFYKPEEEKEKKETDKELSDNSNNDN
jgi:hypothetical protein